jgi:hypothetical protein
MAIAFKQSELDLVREIVRNPKVKTRNYYRPVNGGHEQVTHL